MSRWMWAVALVLGLTGAAEAKKKLAVLEFTNVAGLSKSDAEFLTDVVRGEAVKLPQGKFLIMTKENILEMLPPGVDLATCEGACEVETGRNIGANYLVNGTFRKFGGKLKVSMKLHSMDSGGLISSETGSAKDIGSLENMTRQVAGRLMKPLEHFGKKAKRTFGADLPEWEDPKHEPDESVRAPELGGLADLDVLMLQKFEHANDIDSMEDKSEKDKANAWRELASYNGVSPELRKKAELRAQYWDKAFSSLVRRCMNVKIVAFSYERDKKKLDSLMSLKDSTISKKKKKSLMDEFESAYGVWRKHIKSFKRECDESVMSKANDLEAIEKVSKRLSSAGVQMVKIDGGAFNMGDGGISRGEGPVRQVKVRTFFISKSEVTVAQYKECVDAGECSITGLQGPRCNWGKSGRSSHPINCISWGQARDFSRWAGGRLPSEAEWEYAAKSLGKRHSFPWGNETASCKYSVMKGGGGGCGTGGTMPVCSKPDGNTEQGLCDMAGNVWEWVEDAYGPYKEAPNDGTSRHNGSGGRVNRGGGWQNGPGRITTTVRGRDSPNFWFSSLGFRFVVQNP